MLINKVLGDGTKVEIRVRFNERKAQLEIDSVGIIPKGKRKIRYIGDSRMTDHYLYRTLSFEDKDKVMYKTYVAAVGVDVLNEALEEAWTKLKPLPIDNDAYDIDFDVSNLY